MPNWCRNKATIIPLTDESTALLKAYQQYREDNTSDPKNVKFFEWFHPYRNNSDLDEYNWRVENWGTKWDACERMTVEEDAIYFYDDTAWSPPIRFYDFLCSKGFSIEAEYYEPGACYMGTYCDGNDESESIPSGDSVFSLVCSDHCDSTKSHYFSSEPDFESIKTGEVLVCDKGETIIVVDKKILTWNEFVGNNAHMFDSPLRDWEESVDRACRLNRDLQIITFSDDQSNCEVMTGILDGARLYSSDDYW